MRDLCEAKDGTLEVLQGNIAFAAGCVRAGIHAVDGYPGTPSTEVIDKGLSKVQDLITVGWSVNEAVAVGVGVGHSFAGRDAVVTMKIPGVFQAGDAVSSSSAYDGERGALVYYIASDFTPSSTQHLVDPRPFYRSCFLPVFEPRNHQEMHIAAELAADMSRKFHLPVIIHASGALCHSEGLVSLMPAKKREVAQVCDLATQILLPNTVRMRYDKFMDNRFDAVVDFVEQSEMNKHIKGKGKIGVIATGVNALYMEEYKALFDKDIDVLSLAFTNPLPENKIKEFAKNVEKIYVLDDGYRYLQETCQRLGIEVIGKAPNSKVTEWTPATIAEFLGQNLDKCMPKSSALPRPPMICPGCPYRLTGLILAKMRKKGDLEAVFSDIGCNTLLYFMKALDQNLCMGASESMRAGYVLSKPEAASKCVSILGDGTEVHSGLDATRNTLYRNVPGVKIVLDNEWIAMTGGQPGASSPVNLAGQPHSVKLIPALQGEGAEIMTANAYNRDEVASQLKKALELAGQGKFTVLVIQGTCIRKVPASAYKAKMSVDADKCKKCGHCLICPGISGGVGQVPTFNNMCTKCVSNTPACSQMCPANAISIERNVEEKKEVSQLSEAPIPQISALAQKPERLLLAIRGVGGQGNLFFGKVLARLAFLAGYGESANIVKGETHGMAQLGGPVISTFACGNVYSQELLPQSADCLIAMEKSELLRPGFLTMLKNKGKVLMADTAILPFGFPQENYPSDEAIAKDLEAFDVIKVPVLEIALELGDPSGKCANVVMLGILAKQPTFNEIPKEFWLRALYEINAKPAIWNLNYHAFMRGYESV